MIVTAALCWWDERPEDLVRCVTGCADIADRIIALDGAYRRHPGGTARSGFEQVEAIRDTAASVNLECLILQPERLWAGAVEKRSYLLALASVGTDWIAVVDADHVIHADRAAARAELQGYGRAVDLVSVPFFTPLDPTRSVADTAATNWHGRLAGGRMPLTHLIRALPGLRVERFHWWYSALKAGKRVWVPYGSSNRMPGYPVLRPKALAARYEIEHRSLLRDEAHILDARAFYNDRVMVVAQTGQEDDVPGLPVPVYDYVTVPY